MEEKSVGQSGVLKLFFLLLILASGGVILISMASIAESLVAKNIAEAIPGELFDIFFIPLILFIIPLLAIKISLKKGWGKQMPNWIIVVFSIGAFVFSTFANIGQTYNYFVQADEDIKHKYEGIEIIYAKRFELVPKISDVVNRFTGHEKEIVDSITQARKASVEAKSTDAKVEAINGFDASTRNIIANIENYPNLKSDALFMEFIKIIRETEEEVASAKSVYNDKVAVYNKSCKLFPYVFLARACGYTEKNYFSQKQMKDGKLPAE
jgi:LemA protein